jgi:squalene synthase HpnC
VPVDHYENFPVASLLLPRRVRRDIEVIYAFARSADDLADEGDATADARLAGLAAYSAELARLDAGHVPQTPLFTALGDVIARHALTTVPFHELLAAFRQDVGKHRYADFAEVMAYCRLSANPVGRIMLGVFGDRDARHQSQSDAICSSLQIINFLQDIAIDLRQDRIYLPQDEMRRFGILEHELRAGLTPALWRPFMHQQIARARKLLAAGAPLGLSLTGRFGLEIRMIIAGGSRILGKLHANPEAPLTRRLTLHTGDWLVMLARAIGKR